VFIIEKIRQRRGDLHHAHSFNGAYGRRPSGRAVRAPARRATQGKIAVKLNAVAHSVIDNIPGFFAILGADGVIQAANQRITEYCGQTLEEIQNWGTNGTLHEDDLPQFAIVFAQSIASGTPYHVEARIRRFDGVYRWFDSSAAPVRDGSGKIACWYVILSDIDDLKRAEDALRESQRDLKLTIDTIPALAWSATPDGSADFFNQHYLDFVGLAAAHLQGAAWTAAVHGDDLQSLLTAWADMMASGQGGEAEARLRRHDGEYRRFLFRTNPLRDSSGAIIKWFGVNTDIEDRKRAETDLIDASHHLNEAQRLSRTGSYIADLGRDIHVWSDEFYRICEFEMGSEIKTDSLAGIVLREDMPHFSGAIEQAMAGTQADFEFRIMTKSGVLKHLHGVARRISDEPIFAGAVTDISERKKSEGQLRRSEAFLTKAQELSLTGSFSWRSSAPEEFTWSEQMYRIYEIAPGTRITADVLREKYHPDDAHLMQDALKRARKGAPIDYEHRVVFADGPTKHVHVFATMAPKESEEIEYFGAVQDVTQRRLGQEALDEVRAELEHAARVMSLGTLTASIAHEVNQPLSGIITNANTGLKMLAADPPNIEGAIETARRTIRDGKRASEIIAKLRALFSKREFIAAPVDLNEAAAEVIELTLHDLRRRRIMVETQLEPALPVITGDRVQLQQVILNLVLNASDAMKAVVDRPRQLTLQTVRDAAGARLGVCDTGVGIAKHDFNRLFDPFYTTKTEGMGIGLSVSRGIVERHNGRLWAEANSGPGVTFWFSIPGGTDPPNKEETS
jgi:PAS domain S-box-containing protein